MQYDVHVGWDSDARVWYVERSNIAGLAADSDTVDGLIEKVIAQARDLLEPTGPEIPLNISAHRTARIAHA